MAALACLRVVVEPEHTGLSPAVLGAVVLKFASAYLDSRWRWPRLFSPLTNYSFLLTDPRADEMDVQELGRMPVMDGVTATRTIRDRERQASRQPTPIIAVTANVMPYQTEAYRAAGMDEVVAKPVSAQALLSVMAAILSGEASVASAGTDAPKASQGGVQ